MVKSFPEMQAEILEVNTAVGWAGPGSPDKTFGDCMMLLVTEVAEAMEAYRKWGTDDATSITAEFDTRNGSFYPERYPLPKPEGVGSELADVFIRLLDDCARYGVDLEVEYERKLAYNRTREFRHGGKLL